MTNVVAFRVPAQAATPEKSGVAQWLVDDLTLECCWADDLTRVRYVLRRDGVTVQEICDLDGPTLEELIKGSELVSRVIGMTITALGKVGSIVATPAE